jgi:lysozyme family protein
MQHPFDNLKAEYTHLLSVMQVRPECAKEVDEVAVKLVGYKTRYQPVTDAIGVPILFIGPSFEREASSNFNLNPAQGWPLHSTSKDVPHNGPFPNWFSAAIAAYKIDGLDKVGRDNWIWELICYYGEKLNGFGYRDVHHMHSPYLWGGTNIQTVGKYTEDGKFDPTKMDAQLGIIPMARRMLDIDPTLALPAVPFVPAPPIASGIASEPDAGINWVQTSLNTLGCTPPLDVDGSYGRKTRHAVIQFQQSYGLDTDGLVGPDTTAALRSALAAFEADAKT